MTKLGLKYVSLTRSPVETLEEKIRTTKPHVLISNVESLTSPEIQRRISRLKINYIAVDEAQVADPKTQNKAKILGIKDLRDVFRKKRHYVGIFPILRGGSDPNPLFLSVCNVFLHAKIILRY